MYRKRKTLQELTIRDNFMFGAVMSEEENCRRFLELALEISIARVEIIKEKSISYHPEYKGVRLDIYARDEQTPVIMWKYRWKRKERLGKGADTTIVRWIWKCWYRGKITRNWRRRSGRKQVCKKADISHIIYPETRSISGLRILNYSFMPVQASIPIL